MLNIDDIRCTELTSEEAVIKKQSEIIDMQGRIIENLQKQVDSRNKLIELYKTQVARYEDAMKLLDEFLCKGGTIKDKRLY